MAVATNLADLAQVSFRRLSRRAASSPIRQRLNPRESSSLETSRLRPDYRTPVLEYRQSEEDYHGNPDRDGAHRRQPAPFRPERRTGAGEGGAALPRTDE